MESLEDRPCRFCKKIFTPKVFWQNFCPKKKDEQSCHDKYWNGVYREKAAFNKRLEKVEKQLGIR